VTLTFMFVRKWRAVSLSLLTELMTGFRRRTSSSDENESKITVVPQVLRTWVLPVCLSTHSVCWQEGSRENRSGTVMTHCNNTVRHQQSCHNARRPTRILTPLDFERSAHFCNRVWCFFQNDICFRCCSGMVLKRIQIFLGTGDFLIE
jgi:hypothetical protein